MLARPRPVLSITAPPLSAPRARQRACPSGRRRATAAITGRNPARPRNAVPGPGRVHPGRGRQSALAGSETASRATLFSTRCVILRCGEHVSHASARIRFALRTRAGSPRLRRPWARPRSSVMLRGGEGSPGLNQEERGGRAWRRRGGGSLPCPDTKRRVPVPETGRAARHENAARKRGAPRLAGAAPQSTPRVRRTSGNARGVRILLAALHPTRVARRELALVRCVTGAAVTDPRAVRAGESE